MRENFDSIEKAHWNSALRSDYLSTCSKDMRSLMPACHQSGMMWCWATAVAEVTQLYTTRRASLCTGLECEVVGWANSKQCCPFEAHESECGDLGATWQTVQQAANHYTGMSWKIPNGPLDQKTLDASLQAGNPIIVEVGDETSPNHVVTVHGCDGNGKYWFHDPERDPGEYLLVDYDWLLSMCMAWVKVPQSKEGAKLIVCPSSKAPNEISRFHRKWWNTLYVPVNSTDLLVV